MKVMKFGGTSVGSVNSILSVKRIVEAVDEPVIVVVSALGGITDKLINTSRMAVMLLTRMSSGRLSIVMWK
jgi:aspartokinase/homoserine dehydrogenase 1